MSKQASSGELSKVLKAYDCVTVFMSGEQYITLSALPALVNGLQKAMQSATFETVPVQVFQAAVMEQITKTGSSDGFRA